MTNSPAAASTAPVSTKPSENTIFFFQKLNVTAFVVCIILQKMHEKCAVTNLRDMNMKWEIKFHPASYAFGVIWGLIYLLLLVFVVYQALPESMVSGRNDQFLYSEVGYWFLANMMLNGIWLIVFVRDSKWMFLLAELVNAALLYTCVTIMALSCRAELNTFEAIVIRSGFSLYAGWVTAANVLNIFFAIKSWKSPSVEDDDFKAIKEEADAAESSLTAKALWFCALLYTAVSIEELNPVYGLVFIHVLKAIEVAQ